MPVKKTTSFLATDPFGDETFERLFNELYEPLCRFCMRFVQEKESAEDIVQEQFVYIWEHRSRLTTTISIKSYLYTAVKNRSISHLKKAYVKNRNHDVDRVSGTSLIQDLPDPQTMLENKELGAILEEALAALPLRCRTIFTLKKFGELSHKEISEKLNISGKTVEAQITIAYKKLSHFVADRWDLLLIVTWLTLHSIL